MKKRWFTLIEMLIVIVIIGILAGALIPRIWNARDKANDVAIQANVNALTSAGMQALIDNGTPCNDDNSINYGDLTNYWMSDLSDDNYLCRIIDEDHIVVWYTEMNVETNNNCVAQSINDLDEDANIATILAVVWTTTDNEDVYCLAQ